MKLSLQMKGGSKVMNTLWASEQWPFDNRTDALDCSCCKSRNIPPCVSKHWQDTSTPYLSNTLNSWVDFVAVLIVFEDLVLRDVLCCLARWHKLLHAKRSRCVRKAKAHEEPIRRPSSQQQPWEASQLGVWTMGTQLNKNILQKWGREGEAGQITPLGIKTQKGPVFKMS